MRLKDEEGRERRRGIKESEHQEGEEASGGEGNEEAAVSLYGSLFIPDCRGLSR